MWNPWEQQQPAEDGFGRPAAGEVAAERERQKQRMRNIAKAALKVLHINCRPVRALEDKHS
jgi:hypothetical protein